MSARIYKREINSVMYDYPSVTTILSEINKPYLVPWAVNLTVDYIKENILTTPLNELMENARNFQQGVLQDCADTGTRVHKLIQFFSNGQVVDYSNDKQEVKNCFNAFLKWVKDNEVKFLKSEFVVYLDDLCIGGTVDLLAIVNGKKTIIDIKTSNSISDTFCLQLAAYKKGLSDSECDISVLRIDKKTGSEYEYKNYSENYEKYISAFINLVKFWYSFKQRRINNPIAKCLGACIGQVTEKTNTVVPASVNQVPTNINSISKEQNLVKESEKKTSISNGKKILAVCEAVYELGKHLQEYQGKEKVVDQIVLSFVTEDAQHFYKRLNLSLYNKSLLYRWLVCWRGKDFTKEEIEKFHIASVVSANCYLEIEENNVNGRVYKNITNVSHCEKKVRINFEKNPYTPAWIRNLQESAVIEHQKAS